MNNMTHNSQKLFNHDAMYPNFMLAVTKHPVLENDTVTIQTYVRYKFNDIYKIKKFQVKITAGEGDSFIFRLTSRINELLKEAGDFKKNGYNDYIDEIQED